MAIVYISRVKEFDSVKSHCVFFCVLSNLYLENITKFLWKASNCLNVMTNDLKIYPTIILKNNNCPLHKFYNERNLFYFIQC